MGEVKILLIPGDAPWAPLAGRTIRALRPAARLVQARTAAQALRAAEDGAITLAVADLVLPRPGLGGAAILARLRELYPDCRTALVSDHEALRPLLVDAADLLLLERPVDGEDVARRVVALLAESAGRALETSVAERGEPPARGVPGSEPPPALDRLYGGKYRVTGELGHGGMGSVYRAEDTFIRRTVAIKLMRVPGNTDPEEMRWRMRREVTIAGRLDHPHVVTVHDAGVDGEDVYLVMEMVDGPDLAHVLRERGPLPASEAVAVTLQVLDALAHAHARGFVHRDLKPANVLLRRDGVVKVADFGLAKLLATDNEPTPTPVSADQTQADQRVGTPPYMAPEQFSEAPVDVRCDLYAVGLLLFEMLHGKSFAHHVKPLLRARAYLRGDPALDPSLPVFEDADLQVVLQRALALFPDDRFADAESFAEALVSSGKTSWTRFLRRPLDRWRRR